MDRNKIPRLSSLYLPHNQWDILAGIPALIILLTYAAYTADAITWSVAVPDDPVFAQIALALQLLVTGLIQVDEFQGSRWVLIGRVSTQGQLDKADFDNRLGPIRELATNELNGEIVREFTGFESASTMERETLENVLEMAEADEFDVLGFNNLDRLTRADPWDTIDYLIDLRQTDINLYEHPRKFFAWDDLHDFERLSRSLFFSREWYNRLAEGRKKGVFDEIEKGRWPFKPHFGYVKDSDAGKNDRNLFLDESKEHILCEIFDIYEREQTLAGTVEEVNERFGDELERELTVNRIRTVLTSKLCIGKLEYEGKVGNEIPDLAVVPDDKFRKVQQILESRSRDKPDKIPDPVVDVTTRFGIEYVQSILEQISFRQCKKCGGELEPYSKTDIWGIPVEKVECVDCGYDGPLISTREFMQIHQTAPVTCPFCYRTENLEIEESQFGLEMYHYQCRNCNHSFHTEVGGEDAVHRYVNYPEIGVELNEEDDKSDNEDASNQNSKQGTAPTTSANSQEQTRLEQYAKPR